VENKWERRTGKKPAGIMGEGKEFRTTGLGKWWGLS
jgi:hypothetical protein